MSPHQALAGSAPRLSTRGTSVLPQQTTKHIFLVDTKRSVCSNERCVRSVAGCADSNLAGICWVSCRKFSDAVMTIFSGQSVISRVYTSHIGNSMDRLEPRPRWYKKVPGTVPSGKPRKSEPYRTMQWKSAISRPARTQGTLSLTENAWRSPTFLMEVSAVRSAVFADRNLSSTESSSSKGPLWSPASTTERSEEGTRGGLGGFNFLALPQEPNNQVITYLGPGYPLHRT